MKPRRLLLTHARVAHRQLSQAALRCAGAAAALERLIQAMDSLLQAMDSRSATASPKALPAAIATKKAAFRRWHREWLIRQFARQGMSTTATAEAIGVSAVTVRIWRREYAITTRELQRAASRPGRRPNEPGTHREAADQWLRGWLTGLALSYPDPLAAARVAQVTRSTLRKWEQHLALCLWSDGRSRAERAGRNKAARRTR